MKGLIPWHDFARDALRLVARRVLPAALAALVALLLDAELLDGELLDAVLDRLSELRSSSLRLLPSPGPNSSE